MSINFLLLINQFFNPPNKEQSSLSLTLPLCLVYVSIIIFQIFHSLSILFSCLCLQEDCILPESREHRLRISNAQSKNLIANRCSINVCCINKYERVKLSYLDYQKFSIFYNKICILTLMFTVLRNHFSN